MKLNKFEELQREMELLRHELSLKNQEIERLNLSQASLADANVRIAELYGELEDTMTQLEEQRESLVLKNQELIFLVFMAS